MTHWHNWLVLPCLIFAFACSETTHDSAPEELPTSTPVVETQAPNAQAGKALLRRERVFDSLLKDTISAIQVDMAMLDQLSEAEKAAVGFVSTFVGSECEWDGDAQEDMSNLKCQVISGLGLGYQCSEQHLGFLRKWFAADGPSLDQLENCPIIPNTATSFESFDQLNLYTEADTIVVESKISGVNMRLGETWRYSQTDRFIRFEQSLEYYEQARTEVVKEQF
ncbi:hypothetical protein [Pontibacter sp. G13]|uniref:hypothetical protein n=1 Tax=Pontibacter sp. G13 TaxID=3074898 RepID=UPI00288C5F43|nr:hypothetical protein [Pontibacter sp. G13]WNJ18517.1 hypothetical protein RJD25_26985 [Pontibacter sp. G13]